MVLSPVSLSPYRVSCVRAEGGGDDRGVVQTLSSLFCDGFGSLAWRGDQTTRAHRGRGHPSLLSPHSWRDGDREAGNFATANSEFRIFPRERWAALERFSCRKTVLRRIGRPSVRRLGGGFAATEIPGRRGIFPCRNPLLPPHHDLGMKCPRRARRNRKPSIQ